MNNPGVMFGMLWNSTHGCTPIWSFQLGIKVNAEVYQNMLMDAYLPHMQSKMPIGQAVFQQDGAPSHTAGSTRMFFNRWAKDMELLTWPAASPDLAPHDFSLWGTLVAQMPLQCDNKLNLVAQVFAQHTQLSQTTDNNKIIVAFEARLRACVAAKGGPFEL